MVSSASALTNPGTMKKERVRCTVLRAARPCLRPAAASRFVSKSDWPRDSYVQPHPLG
jgi:hypothetical protein